MSEPTVRALRLFRLAQLLALAPTGGLTSKELARRLGCGERSIQRDILALESLYIPIRRTGAGYMLTRQPGWLANAIERNEP